MRQKDETKAQDILQAALDEIQAVGLAGLSVEAVARRAGVATGTVYTYFKGKEALLNALYLHTKQKFAAFVLRDEGQPLRATFRRMTRAYLDYMIDNQAEMIFMGQMAHSPYLSEATRESVALGLKPVDALFARGKAEQLLKDMDPALMLAFLHGTLSGMAPLAGNLPPARREAFAEDVVTLCWDALKA